MASFAPAPAHPQNREAALAIAAYAAFLGLTDNLVRLIAAEAGLWQFHATRAVFALTLLFLGAAALRLRLRPQSLRAVAARSAVHGTAMLIYFGALGFLPVAQVVAGLFTAPLFIVLYARALDGTPLGGLRLLAIALGFAGVLLMLGPAALSGLSAAALMPVLAGAFYALGNRATQKWCPGESAATLLAGFFTALGLLGLIGLAVLALAPQGGAEAGFLLRPYTAPSGAFLLWTFVQALGSLLGVGLLIWAYQKGEAAAVSVFEYMLLPVAALWSWFLWGEVPGLLALAGMGLIAASGILIAKAPAP